MTPARRPAIRSTVLWLLVTAAWAVQMSALSTSSFSSYRTESFLLRLLVACDLPVSPDTLRALHTVLRKFSHAMVYAVLTLLLYRSIAGRWAVWRPRIARWCVAAAALYGLMDEFHQFFVPDRGASILDWGIDATGAVLAMLLIYGWWRLLTDPHARY